MRNVSVFIPEAKSGRRKAVRVEDAEIAVLLVAWRDAVEASEGPDARLFPPAARLRSDLAEALAPFRVEARSLHFTFHSFRHGGASRAYLAGSDMADILLRGRWKVESSPIRRASTTSKPDASSCWVCSCRRKSRLSRVALKRSGSSTFSMPTLRIS